MSGRGTSTAVRTQTWLPTVRIGTTSMQLGTVRVS